MKEPTGSHARGAAAEQIPENKLFHAHVRSSSQYCGSKRKESHDERLVCVVPARLRSEGDGACAEEGGHEERPWLILSWMIREPCAPSHYVLCRRPSEGGAGGEENVPMLSSPMSGS